MAFGPIKPFSSVPVSPGTAFPNIHIGDGPNSKHEHGLGVSGFLLQNAIWRLRFDVPSPVPSGTATLRLLALAKEGNANAKVNVKWASVSAGQDPSSATLVAEGTQTLNWVAGGGDIDKYKELKTILDANTINSQDVIVMDLTFESSGWTLATKSTWIPSLWWE